MSITEIINAALNNISKAQVSALYDIILAISQSKREPKSILSGIASSFNNAVQAEGFGQAVNESLGAMSNEEAEEVLGRIQDLVKSSSQEAAVSGVLRELSGLIDEKTWESPEREGDESPQAKSEQDEQAQSESSLPGFESLPEEVRNNMSEESKQAHLAQAQEAEA